MILWGETKRGEEMRLESGVEFLGRGTDRALPTS